jgi:hypothetical protein
MRYFFPALHPQLPVTGTLLFAIHPPLHEETDRPKTSHSDFYPLDISKKNLPENIFWINIFHCNWAGAQMMMFFHGLLRHQAEGFIP